MSIGNTRDQGNKGSNFPYQLANLKLLGSISEGIDDLNKISLSLRLDEKQEEILLKTSGN